MNSADQIRKIIEHQLEIADIDRSPEMLYSPIRYALGSGGKRMRPVLTLLSCEAFSDQWQSALNAAMAIEIFHNFTLLHDDIMDNSSMRRGQPTVHCRWNDNTAILSGDAMLILSYEILARSNPELIVKLLPIFTRVALEVCEGQQLDMDFESCEEVSLENYIEMIRLKTGVLLAGAVQLGALCGGASDKDAELMYEFGVNLGLLFQITDDILDTYGDPKVFGKSIGGDILCRKKTFLLVSALQNATEQQRDRLCKLLEDESLAAAEKIAAVTAIYDEFNIRQVAEQASDKYFRLAMEALEQVSLDKNRKSELAEYATKIRYREK
jgi:geranylgeranyl diphosphate synthase type II